MEDDFQIVDFGPEQNNELKALQEELEKLSNRHSQLKEMENLEKNIKECRKTMTAMLEEMKQMKEEKQRLRDRVCALDSKNKELLEQTKALQKEVQSLKDTAKAKKVEETDVDAKSCVSLKELDKSKCYACKNCGTHISLEGDIASRNYQVGQGAFTEKKRGYLFNCAVNLTLGATKTEKFTTGSYEIAWVSCSKCAASLGWKYLSTNNQSNASKVGKLCLARYSLTSPQEKTEQL
ncbi:fad NAD binding oxidoreductase [Reticulomyxa filosa]|uniref:Fad NAD binding oxidoreductase n=1 Tax=Reticulomyxa filosa TaxID=46433 RepID=X6L7Y4_RETFI|nr:fad NAD binding oxidoreductase [Reticulomyxa filosa]|eukprot:ETN97560.1 fad NAD binding oxidoreductase [Reticulomyxa filosa]